ncbi:Hypothetical protein A7982_07045 [Minicystis rosea]|nr:Hypothetical protein A7982_07045 [Minicystis rosea]
MPPAPPSAPSPVEIAASVRAAAEGSVLLVGAGQLAPHPGWSRVSVLCLHEAHAPLLLWDAFLPDIDLPVLRDALSAFATVWPATFDTMYATPWHLAWTVPPAPFRIYDGDGLTAAVDGARITLGSGERARFIDASAVARVLGWVGGDGVDRGLDLVLRTDERVTLAVQREPTAAWDPTYDGLDLSFDAAWIPAAGKVLARALDVPYEASERALA